jgi:hypothetical protein
MGSGFVKKAFYDEHGNLALFQFPNAPIIIWALAALAGHIFTSSWPHKIFSFISLFAIIIWALLEIFSGVSYFRRALGLIVLVFTIYLRFLY